MDDPTFSQLYIQLMTNRALGLYRKGEYEKVVEDCERVIERESGNMKAIYRRGLGKMGMGKMKEALEDMRLVNQKDPHNKVVREKIKEIEARVKEIEYK